MATPAEGQKQKEGTGCGGVGVSAVENYHGAHRKERGVGGVSAGQTNHGAHRKEEGGSVSVERGGLPACAQGSRSPAKHLRTHSSKGAASGAMAVEVTRHEALYPWRGCGRRSISTAVK
eukprot:scaffold27912_cov72-Isochrysis_galbana.AAC.2